MFVADVIPVPDQLYVTGEEAVVALTFTEVTVQFSTPDAAGVTTSAVVLCVTACDPVVVQPLDVFVMV
jgi:hypothetical protein